MNKINTTPKSELKAGLYFARGHENKRFNFIVEVYGEVPFLRMRGWERIHDKVFPLNPDEIEEFGPRITTPEESEAGE